MKQQKYPTAPMNFLIPVTVVGNFVSQVGDVFFEEVTLQQFQLQSMMGEPVQYCL